MKALYRVSDGWIFNAPCDESKLTEHEWDLIEVIKMWALILIPDGLSYGIKDYKIVNSSFELLPEEQRSSYIPPEENEVD